MLKLSVKSGITQIAVAEGGGNASNSIDNDGALSIAAVAVANATGVTSSADADADATVSGIYQSAYATGGGDASSVITNAGALTISATANANAGYGIGRSLCNGQLCDLAVGSCLWQRSTRSFRSPMPLLAGRPLLVRSTSARWPLRSRPRTRLIAYASLGSAAIYQNADATGGGYATANIDNGGTINLLADGYASGTQATATPLRSLRSARRPMRCRAAMRLPTSPTRVISASARLLDAVGTVNGANAYATIDMGINQEATASSDGVGTASLDNSGSLTLEAIATANAETHRLRLREHLLRASIRAQKAARVEQLAELTNSGPLDISAVADANGSSATAEAYVANAHLPSGLCHRKRLCDCCPEQSGGRCADDQRRRACRRGQRALLMPRPRSLGGIKQFATASSGIALASVANSGTMTIAANATATGVTAADAARCGQERDLAVGGCRDGRLRDCSRGPRQQRDIEHRGRRQRVRDFGLCLGERSGRRQERRWHLPICIGQCRIVGVDRQRRFDQHRGGCLCDRHGRGECQRACTGSDPNGPGRHSVVRERFGGHLRGDRQRQRFGQRLSPRPTPRRAACRSIRMAALHCSTMPDCST